MGDEMRQQPETCEHVINKLNAMVTGTFNRGKVKVIKKPVQDPICPTLLC